MNSTFHMLTAHGLGDTPEARFERDVCDLLADKEAFNDLDIDLADDDSKTDTRTRAIQRIVEGRNTNNLRIIDDGIQMLVVLYDAMARQKLKDEGRREHEEVEEEEGREQWQNKIERINNYGR